MANHTLEQDVFQELMSSRHSYAVALTADKNRDLGTYNRGRDVNQVAKIAGLNKWDSADSCPRKVQEMTGYHPEDAGEAFGKLRNFDQQNVGARSPKIELLSLS